jgi:hypothetical protein
MTTAVYTIERKVHFRHAGHGRGKQLHDGPVPEAPRLPRGRVPRIARLMALALHFDELIRTGEVVNYTEVARLGRVTRARVSQVMSLVYLAPDIQEAVLLLPRTERGRDAIILRDLLPIAAVSDWRQQRRLWADLTEA